MRLQNIYEAINGNHEALMLLVAEHGVTPAGEATTRLLA